MRVFADADDLARAARAELLRRAGDLLEERGRFTLALSGGSTPRRLYRLLAPDDVDWSRVELFFGDERCVPPDHADSNYRMVREALLERVPIPAANVHRMRGELGADEAAHAYELELRAAFRLGPKDLPRFDLVLLGLGTDGHTASLFPGTSALDERERLVAPGRSPGASADDRVTLTFPVLNAAAAVAFVVAGSEKAAVVAALSSGGDAAGALPASRVRPGDGRVIWMLDHAAAARFA